MTSSVCCVIVMGSMLRRARPGDTQLPRKLDTKCTAQVTTQGAVHACPKIFSTQHQPVFAGESRKSSSVTQLSPAGAGGLSTAAPAALTAVGCQPQCAPACIQHRPSTRSHSPTILQTLTLFLNQPAISLHCPDGPCQLALMADMS